MQGIRIYEMPECKMVSSGIGMFGEEKFERFYKWFSSQKPSLFPKNFLFHEQNGFNWLYIYEESMLVPDELEIIDFSGGFYAAATDIDQHTDVESMNREINLFLEQNGFERDNSRAELGSVISSLGAQKIMGYAQMDYYTPVKAKR